MMSFCCCRRRRLAPSPARPTDKQEVVIKLGPAMVPVAADDEVALASDTDEELNTPSGSDTELVRSWIPGQCKLLAQATEPPRSGLQMPGGGAAPGAYLVDRGRLRVRTRGLAYRRSPSLADKDGEELAPWGSLVRGVALDGEWLDVGGRYLPFRLRGALVLRRLEDQPAADGDQPDPFELEAAGDKGSLEQKAISVSVRRPCGKVLLPAFRLLLSERLEVLRKAVEVASGCGVGLQCRLVFGTQLLLDSHTVELAGLRDGSEVLAVVGKDEKTKAIDDIIPVDSDGEEELNTPEGSDNDS